MLGQYLDAKVDYERALRINESWLGPDNIMVATSLDGVGNVNVRLGNYEEGKAAYIRALAIKERTLRPDHSDLLITRRALADVLYYLGDPAAAIQTIEPALATAEKSFGSEHVAVAQFVASLAKFKLATGAVHEAGQLYERSLATAERLGSTAIVAASLYGMGRVALRESRPASAVSLFERCNSVWSASVSASPGELAEIRFHLAMALAAAGEDRPRAVLLAEQAAATMRDLGAQPESDVDLDEIDAWLKEHKL